MASEQEVGGDGDGPTDRETSRSVTNRDTERQSEYENDGIYEKIVKILRRKECGCCRSEYGRAWLKETEHFTNTTTMHGPKRVFNGKECWIRILWAFVFMGALGFLLWQICTILHKHIAHETLGQISFNVSTEGMVFPAVTLCNLNPIQKSEIEKLRRSGDLSYDVLEYLLQTKMDATFHFSNLDRSKLGEVHEKAKVFMLNHPEFNIDNFLKTAGHSCEDTFPMCFFGSEKFECCQYMEPVVTSIGKCYTLDLANRAPEWMQKQKSPGSDTGLQIIADANLEEEMNVDIPEEETMFFEIFEHGFRYFVHHPDAHPELSSEGVSVGPGNVVYTAIKKSTASLLDEENHKRNGCRSAYPPHFNANLTYYSAPACRYLCLAHHFTERCNCTPFTFNIDGNRTTCLPHESVACMDENWTVGNSSTGNRTHLKLPECGECAFECEGITYTTFNSYGNAFNNGSLQWLYKELRKTKEHIQESVSIIHIFYSEMFHTEYTLISLSDWSKTWSDIGGNMGMFAGMSVITISEIIIYLFKSLSVRWSGDRRTGLNKKADDDDDQARCLEEEVVKYQERKRRNDELDISNLEAPRGASPQENPDDENNVERPVHDVEVVDEAVIAENRLNNLPPSNPTTPQNRNDTLRQPKSTTPKRTRRNSSSTFNTSDHDKSVRKVSNASTSSSHMEQPSTSRQRTPNRRIKRNNSTNSRKSQKSEIERTPIARSRSTKRTNSMKSQKSEMERTPIARSRSTKRTNSMKSNKSNKSEVERNTPRK